MASYAGTLTHVAHRVMRWIGILLSFALASLNLGVKVPITQRGIQCPTAAVQQVTEVKLVKNCCGKLVPQTQIRQPREGEPEFKQCRCAEKKAADHEEQKSTFESFKPIQVATVSNRNAFALAEALPAIQEKLTLVVDGQTPPPSPPLTPPPQLI